ncbi:MAG: OsmC family protein [Planctomycetota bacterium]
MADATTTAVQRAGEGLRTEISTGLHAWTGDGKRTDELSDPAGPNPFAQLLGALASCMAMTARLYADRKGWALDEVRVAVSNDREEGHVLERLRAEVSLSGGLSDEERDRVFTIATRCPVHRTLAPAVAIEAVLV